MKQSTTLRRRFLPLAVISLVAIATIVMPASPASAAVNKNGVLYADGARAGSYNGDMHYSALAQESYNEFCLGNPDLNDGYKVVAESWIINYRGDTVLNASERIYEAKESKLGCFTHVHKEAGGTDKIETRLTVCLEKNGKKSQCQAAAAVWKP